jgi:hypothetical protein
VDDPVPSPDAAITADSAVRPDPGPEYSIIPRVFDYPPGAASASHRFLFPDSAPPADDQ